jgi:citrate synthase
VNCISRISFINGEKDIFEYRGYPIEELAENSSFLETAFLVIYGELPNEKQLKTFNKKIMKNSKYHHQLENFIK